MLQRAEIGSDLELLSDLELTAKLEEEHADNAFVSFIEARQVLGRPVLLSGLPYSREQSGSLAQEGSLELPLALEASPELPQEALPEYPESLPLPSKQGSWIRRTIIRPIRKRLG